MVILILILILIILILVLVLILVLPAGRFKPRIGLFQPSLLIMALSYKESFSLFFFLVNQL